MASVDMGREFFSRARWHLGHLVTRLSVIKNAPYPFSRARSPVVTNLARDRKIHKRKNVTHTHTHIHTCTMVRYLFLRIRNNSAMVSRIIIRHRSYNYFGLLLTNFWTSLKVNCSFFSCLPDPQGISLKIDRSKNKRGICK